MSTVRLVTAPALPRIAAPSTSALQRRTIITLIAAQITGGMGLAAAVTVGGLIAADLGGDAAAGLPLAAAVTGTATAALPLAAVMRRSGRRPGLRLGWLVGAVGALLAVTATVQASLPLLLTGMVLFGGAEAASSAARYAAADLAPPARRGTAIGMVVSSTAVTATVGPGIVGPATAGAAAVGLPALAGPFVVSIVAFTLASAVITIALRPDPLVVASAAAPADGAAAPVAAAPSLAGLLRLPAVRLGVAAAVVANFTMLALMTVMPLHLTAGHGHGDDLGLIGLIISVHVGGMFAPAPLAGRLGDRIGHRSVVAIGAALLAVAGIVAAGTGPHQPIHLLVALLLQGVGWNLAFVGGSALLTSAVAPAHRPRVQGLADTAMGVAGVVGAASSGVLMAWAGFGRLGLLCAATATALLMGALRRA
jgi:MFS family permease